MSEYVAILESALDGNDHGSQLFTPLPSVDFDEHLPSNVVVAIPQEHKQRLYKHGLELISSGKVAIAILAGGQGTRLSDGNVKALANVTPIKHKSLLQLMFEKLNRLFSMCNVLKQHPCVYLLTSTCTRDPIVQLLQQHKYFGLSSSRVVILTQPNLPCFTILERKHLKYPTCIDGICAQAIGDDDGEWIAVAPNGNGALYAALASNETFNLQLPRLEWLHVVGIDNCLCKPLDPEFLGLGGCAHENNRLDALVKCIECRIGQNLGIFCSTSRGKVAIVEYSEMHRIKRQSLEQFENSSIYGNVCDHLFSGKFLHNILSNQLYKQMPFHAARKQVPYFDEVEGLLKYPAQPNCFKLELFIFDALSFCNNVVCMLVDAKDSFLPVKRAEDLQRPVHCHGSDDNYQDDTSVQARLSQVYKRWLACSLDGYCEVSPLVSYGGEGLEDYKGKVDALPRYIG